MQYIDQTKFASFFNTLNLTENTGYMPGACYQNMMKAQRELYPKSSTLKFGILALKNGPHDTRYLFGDKTRKTFYDFHLCDVCNKLNCIIHHPIITSSPVYIDGHFWLEIGENSIVDIPFPYYQASISGVLPIKMKRKEWKRMKLLHIEADSVVQWIICDDHHLVSFQYLFYFFCLTYCYLIMI